MNSPATQKVRKTDRAVARIIDGEALVVQPQEGLVNVVNAVGTMIWGLCDGTLTVAEIARRVSAEYEVSEEVALRDALEFVADLVDKGLLEFCEQK